MRQLVEFQKNRDYLVLDFQPSNDPNEKAMELELKAMAENSESESVFNPYSSNEKVKSKLNSDLLK